jgi:hypothetical protein
VNCPGVQGIKTVWMPGPWESRQARANSPITFSHDTRTPFFFFLFLVCFPAFSGVFVGLLFRISRVVFFPLSQSFSHPASFFFRLLPLSHCFISVLSDIYSHAHCLGLHQHCFILRLHTHTTTPLHQFQDTTPNGPWRLQLRPEHPHRYQSQTKHSIHKVCKTISIKVEQTNLPATMSPPTPQEESANMGRGGYN